MVKPVRRQNGRARELESVAESAAELVDRLIGSLNRYGYIDPEMLAISDCCERPPCSQCAAVCLADHYVARVQLAVPDADRDKAAAPLIKELRHLQSVFRDLARDADRLRYSAEMSSYIKELGISSRNIHLMADRMRARRSVPC